MGIGTSKNEHATRFGFVELQTGMVRGEAAHRHIAGSPDWNGLGRRFSLLGMFAFCFSSKIGSSTSVAAVMQTRSRTLEMPRKPHQSGE